MKKLAIQLAGLLLMPTFATAATFLGIGSSTGQISRPIEMNEICRRTFSAQEIEFGNVRWASTRDFSEASNQQGWGGDPVHLSNIDQIAFRAEDTIFTPEGRAYDQATGALAPIEKNKYPGAVIVKANEATFAAKKNRANPMCVRGSPST